MIASVAMKNAIKLIAVMGLALGLGGCPQGQAKVFAQTQTGGTLILEGDEGKAMADADKKMAMHCGMGNYQVVSRDTVVVGHENYSDSVAQQQGQTDSAGVVSTAGSSTSDSASQGSSAAVVGSDGYGNAYGAEGHQDSSSTVNTNEQTTVGASSTQSSGVQTASSVSGTREVRELRLTYACAGAGPAPAAAAPAQ